MIVLKEMSHLQNRGPIALAIGFFDGVHLGHQEVLRTLRQEAAAASAEPWILTLDPHPLRIIAPERAPRLLTSLQHKLRIMEALGVQGAVVLRFDHELRELPPDRFVSRLLSASELRAVTVGENWRFGLHGKGSVTLLADRAARRGLKLAVVPPRKHRDSPISSTRIRAAVRGGDLREAAAMLGRPYSILGEVVAGHRVGRRLGWPTANVLPRNEVHPPNGVYAAWALTGGRLYPAAAYIGTAPTFHFADRDWIVEVNILDQHLELYGSEVEVFLTAAIRPEQVFTSADALREQIAQDVKQIRELLRNGPAGDFHRWRAYLREQGVQLD